MAAASTWMSFGSGSQSAAPVAGSGRTSAPGKAARTAAISPRAMASCPAPSFAAARAHSSRMRSDQSGANSPAPATPSTISRSTVG